MSRSERGGRTGSPPTACGDDRSEFEILGVVLLCFCRVGQASREADKFSFIKSVISRILLVINEIDVYAY